MTMIKKKKKIFFRPSRSSVVAVVSLLGMVISVLLHGTLTITTTPVAAAAVASSHRDAAANANNNAAAATNGRVVDSPYRRFRRRRSLQQQQQQIQIPSVSGISLQQQPQFPSLSGLQLPSVSGDILVSKPIEEDESGSQTVENEKEQQQQQQEEGEELQEEEEQQQQQQQQQKEELREEDLDCTLYDERDLVGDGKTLFMRHVANPIAETVTVEVVYANHGWIGFSFAKDEYMFNNIAVFGNPDTEIDQVAKYMLGGSYLDSKLPEKQQQTLTDASVMQNETHTILRFTKPLIEDGEVSLSLDGTTPVWILYAAGKNALGHQYRNAFQMTLTPCRTMTTNSNNNNNSRDNTIQLSDSGAAPNRNLWKAHGICMALAFGIFMPLAIGSSLLRNYVMVSFPSSPGIWYKLHLYLNVAAVVLTVTGFALAVRATAVTTTTTTTNASVSPTHFIGNAHSIVGLVIFLLVMLQALGGICRPNAPQQTNKKVVTTTADDDDTGGGVDADANADASNNNVEDLERKGGTPAESEDSLSSSSGDRVKIMESAATTTVPTANAATTNATTVSQEETKTTARYLWEYGHRILGLGLLFASWYNCDSGITLFVNRFGANTTFRWKAVFWGVTASLTLLIVIAYIWDRIRRNRLDKKGSATSSKE